MRPLHLLIAAALARPDLHAAEPVLEWFRDQGAPPRRIWGSRNYNGFVEVSPDLCTGSALPDQPPLLAHRSNPPVRRLRVPAAGGGQLLLQPSVLHTKSLDFCSEPGVFLFQLGVAFRDGERAFPPAWPSVGPAQDVRSRPSVVRSFIRREKTYPWPPDSGPIARPKIPQPRTGLH